MIYHNRSSHPLLRWLCLPLWTLVVAANDTHWHGDCPVYPGGGSITELPTLDVIPSELQSVLNDIVAMIEANVTTGVLPGAGLEINYAGAKLISQGFGLADNEKGKEWSVNSTLTRIASVSKILPSLLMHQANAAEAIAMHAPVSETVPNFHPINPFDDESDNHISWYQLASQTSGLDREGPIESLLKDCSNTDALDLLGKRFLKWAPGTQPAYSNWAFALLGNLLSEDIFNDTNFSASVSARIATPLSLHNTGMDYSKDVLEALAVGYTEGTVAPFEELHYLAPAGAAYSTVADLTHLAQTLLAAYHGEKAAANRLNFPISHARLMLRSPAYWNDDYTEGPTGFGTPWELKSIKNFYVASKGGNLAGYATLISIIPTLNVSVVMAMNTDADDFAWMQTINELLLPALNDTLVGLQQAADASPCPYVEDVVGTYTIALPDGPDVDTVTAIVQQGGTAKKPTLVLVVQENGATILRGFLDYVQQKASPNELYFRFVYPASAQGASCFIQELEALEGSPVVFHTKSGGANVTSKADSVEMYAFPGVVAQRVGHDHNTEDHARTPPLFDRAAYKQLVRRLGGKV